MLPIGAKWQRHHAAHRSKRQYTIKMRKQAGAGTAAGGFPFQALTQGSAWHFHHQQISDASAVLCCACAQLRGARKMQKPIAPIIRATLIGARGRRSAPIIDPYQRVDEFFHEGMHTEFQAPPQSGA